MAHRGDAARREGRKCIAESCPMRVVNDHVFCDEHWGMIDPDVKQRLGDLYISGQFDDLSGACPSQPWLRVARMAIKKIASTEKRKRQKNGQRSG